MTVNKKPSLVTVLLGVVGLAVAVDIAIIANRPKKAPAIPDAQPAVVAVIELPMQPPSATEPPVPFALATKGAPNEPFSSMDISTPDGQEMFRQNQMTELRKQANTYTGDPTHYHASEAEIRIMESNKSLVW